MRTDRETGRRDIVADIHIRAAVSASSRAVRERLQFATSQADTGLDLAGQSTDEPCGGGADKEESTI
jgi:hypothetical protein